MAQNVPKRILLGAEALVAPSLSGYMAEVGPREFYRSIQMGQSPRLLLHYTAELESKHLPKETLGLSEK